MEEKKVPITRNIKATDDHRAIHTGLTNKVLMLAKKYKDVRIVDLIGIYARILGSLIARINPSEREIVKSMALTNIDQAIEQEKVSTSKEKK